MLEDQKDARLMSLEQGITEAIAYLRRLPPVPTTMELISSLEQRLTAYDAPQALHGARHAAAGILIVEVTVLDRVAVVQTGAPKERAERLWEVLSEGVAVPLLPA